MGICGIGLSSGLVSCKKEYEFAEPLTAVKEAEAAPSVNEEDKKCIKVEKYPRSWELMRLEGGVDLYRLQVPGGWLVYRDHRRPFLEKELQFINDKCFEWII